MKIQNIADTITADPEAFALQSEWTVNKRNNEPFLIEEYFIRRVSLDDYRTRISVLDEDQLPIVTAVVDIYDDIEEAERQLAFVGGVADFCDRNLTDAQLNALLDCYDLFVEKADFPTSRNQDFDDLRLVQFLSRVVYRGGTVEGFFTPVITRKNHSKDYSQHKFRETATQIVNRFLPAS